MAKLAKEVKYSLVAPMAVEGFKAGAEFTTKSQITDYLTAFAKASMPDASAFKLSADQVWSVYRKAPDQNDVAGIVETLTKTEPEDLERQHEPTPDASTSGYVLRKQAREIGAMFPTGMTALLRETQDKAEDVSGSIIMLADWIDRTPALAAKLDAGPIPGSRKDAKPGKIGYYEGVNNWDIYTLAVPGKERPEKVSQYADAFDATSFGTEIAEIEAVMDRIIAEKENKDDAAKWEKFAKEQNEAPIAHLRDAHKRKAVVKRWKDRRDRSVARFRNAQAFRMQKKALADVGIKTFLLGDLKTAANKNNPLELQYVDPTDGRTYSTDPKSIGTFLRYDVKAAKAAADAQGKPVDYEAIKATLKREPRTPQTPRIPKDFEVKDMTDVVYALDGFFGTSAMLVEWRKELNKTDNDELLLSFASVVNKANKFLAPFMPRVDALNSAALTGSKKTA